ncbi:hypothetical protein DHEL01_v207295 [Diaporthe helianthi]|uniref:Uncharacterized protein n=1 Tax=Diaporthe helianthi TaxID=158607 RepID=A0A2P5HVM5_DIAHE|nr:hypothetical protein DHEL01_v207295 [Diaporthe helianthi]
MLRILKLDGRVAPLGDAVHPHSAGVAISGSPTINTPTPFTTYAAPTHQLTNSSTGSYSYTIETRQPLVNRLPAGVHALVQKTRLMAEKKTMGEQDKTDGQPRARISNGPNLSWLTEPDFEAECRKFLEPWV